MTNFKSVFVTIGTTKFDSLIQTVCSTDFLESLRDLGCTQLVIQFGRGDGQLVQNAAIDGIKIRGYSIKPSILEDIKQADLVISHAGAGSCLEILKEQKPLVVVINERLMGNHQIELAEQLCNDKNLFHCTPKHLETLLSTCSFSELEPYEKGDMTRFVNQLNILMGFNIL